MRRIFKQIPDQDVVRLGLAHSLQFPIQATEFLSFEEHHTSDVPVSLTMSGSTTDTLEIVYRIAEHWEARDPDTWDDERSETDSVFGRSETESVFKLLQNLGRLNSFRFLQSGWNGYDADPLDNVIISKARDLLLAEVHPEEEELESFSLVSYSPEIFPTARDSIQFEYRREDGGYLEVEIYSDSFGIYLDADGEELERDDLSHDEVVDIIRGFHAGQ